MILARTEEERYVIRRSDGCFVAEFCWDRSLQRAEVFTLYDAMETIYLLLRDEAVDCVAVPVHVVEDVIIEADRLGQFVN